MSNRRQDKIRSEYGAATVLVLIALMLCALAGIMPSGMRSTKGGASAQVINIDDQATEGGFTTAASSGSTSLSTSLIKAGSSKTVSLRAGSSTLHTASNDEMVAAADATSTDGASNESGDAAGQSDPENDATIPDAEDSNDSQANQSAQDDASQEDGQATSADEADQPEANQDEVDDESTADELEQQGERKIKKKLACVNGTTYLVKITFDEDANIPSNAQLKLVELNPSLTKKQKESEANKDRPYDTERFVSKSALNQRGEVLDRWLELTDDDYRFFTKYVDVSIVADGKTVVPDAPVEVTIETTAIPRDKAGAIEVALKVPVDKPTEEDPFAYELLGGENVTDDKDSTSKVTFVTDEFGEFAVAGVAYSMGTWDVDDMTINVMGPRDLDSANIRDIDVDVDDGIELREAFTIDVSPSPAYGTTLWVSAKPAEGASAQDEEGGLYGYRVWRGSLADRLFDATGTSKPAEIRADVDSVALVWDSGYRSQSLTMKKVTVDGLLPEGVTGKAVSVRKQYSDLSSISKKLVNAAKKKGAELKAVAAYDINLTAEGEAYQPTEDNPVTVSISSIFIKEGGLYEVWRVQNDGKVTVVDDATQDGDTMTFEAASLDDTYVVVETTITTTLEASNGQKYRVTVTYDNTTGVPEDAELVVNEIEEGQEGYEAYVEKTAEALGGSVDSFAFARAFDITLVDPETGGEYQPASDVRVSIELLNEDVASRKGVNVVHIPDGIDASGEVMDATVNGEAVEFTTDGFSVYVITGDEHLCTYTFFSYNESGSRSEYMFESEEGDVTSSITIKNGEKLTAPQNPTDPSNPDATFVGWYAAVADSTAPYASDGTPELESEPFDFDQPQNITDESITRVNLYAKFSEVLYVRFHGYEVDGTTTSLPVIQTVMLESSGDKTVNLSNYTASYNDSSASDAFPEYIFYGWSEEQRAAGEMEAGDVIAEDSYSVTKDTDLYPLFVAIRWLTPVSGNAGTSAKYFPPFSFQALNGPTSLSAYIPTRPGYVFQGWYLDVENLGQDSQNGTGIQLTDETGNFVDDFDNAAAEAYGVRVVIDGDTKKLSLSRNVSIYANWEVQTDPVNYTIVVWKQQPTESSEVTEKHYEFAESFVLSGVADERVSVGNDYQTLNEDASYNAVHPDSTLDEGATNPYSEYVFNGDESEVGPKSIKPKGNRVFNLYYDRSSGATAQEPQSEYTLRFVVTDTETVEVDLAPGVLLSSRVPEKPAQPEDAPNGDTELWPEGYDFYWYVDSGYSTRAFFSQGTAYNHYDDNKVLFEKMPEHDLTVYGQWKIRRFRVNVDPNYGALATESNGTVTGNGSTWFNVDYGERIEEYTNVTRDFVSSESGDYYYVNHNNASYSDRYTYYTQDVTKATELTTFKYAPDTYRGEGWYKVNADGSETSYDFTQIVTEDTTLRLHWKLAGTYYLEYNVETTLNGKTMKGTLINGDEATLSDGYDDQAVIYLTGAANPPESYEFIGWQVRGDESGTIYRPGSYLTLPAEYAVTVNGSQKVFLDAVYSQVVRAKILYDANGGTIDPQTVDYGGPTDSSAPAPKKSVRTGNEIAIISNLVNNSEVTLSSGAGFSCTDSATGEQLTLSGWYQLKEDGTKEYFDLGQVLNVDVDEPVKLYARWKVKVYFDKNDADATFSETGWSDYTREEGGTQYSTEVDLNDYLTQPEGTASLDDQAFDFWSTTSGGAEENAFDFDNTQVNGSLTLYAHYTNAAFVPFHVLEQTGEGPNASYTEKSAWRQTTTIRVSPDVEAVNFPNDLASYVSLPDDYQFVCAYVGTEQKQTVSDADKITAIKNNNGSLFVTKDGTDVALNDGEEIYIVYAPEHPLTEAEVRIVYVKESAGGVLEAIKGSTDGEAAINDITYNRATLVMNGVDVEQNQVITVTTSRFTISQDTSSSAFNMPPLLDDGIKKLDLIYDRIGVGGQSGLFSSISDNIDDLGENVSNGLTLYLKIVDNKLTWSFDGNAWHIYDEETPTVYAIYRERGFELTLTKDVTKPSSQTGIPQNKSFSVTISSDAITRESYEAEGTGYHTVDATAATDGRPGKILLSVKDGSNFKIRGLSKGDYTITESLPDASFIMRASVDGEQEPSANPTIQLESFEKDTLVALANEPQAICQIPAADQDPVQFYTLNKALEYAGNAEHSGRAEIQMLMDYVIPSTDTVEIPEGYNITLTSTAGNKFTITRDAQLVDEPLFTNKGELRLGSITLDGGNNEDATLQASAPLVRNEGTLSVTNQATLQHANSSKDGGAIYSTGSLTIGGALNDNNASRGGAVYAAGGTLSITGNLSNNSASSGGAIFYAGSGEVTISGGSMTSNAATTGNGGALYATGGTIRISNATVGGTGEGDGNTASNGKGGGIYVENAVIELSGNASISGNSAQSGGGIYAESGEMTLSGTVSDNTATTGNGGGVYLERGELTMDGGSMTTNTASAGYGGAIYTDDGSVTISGGTIGGGGNTSNANTAKNGSAVFVNAGSATFSNTTITYNTTSDTDPTTAGGAVGIGSETARLYFTGTPTIQNNNARGTGNDYCNVYLNQDSDQIINATNLTGGFYIGVYVPGAFEDEEGLFPSRGTVCARYGTFGTLNKDTVKNNIKNDRLSEVQTGLDTTTNKLYWYKSFNIDVRTLDSYNNTLPPDNEGTRVTLTDTTYDPPASKNAASVIAEDVIVKKGISSSIGSRTFNSAFAKLSDSNTFGTFNDYVKEINWDDSKQKWIVVKRDGTSIPTDSKTLDTLRIYYTYPAYLSIENNSDYPLTIDTFTISVAGRNRNVINTASQTGYGYVVSIDGETQSALLPVETASFPAGKKASVSADGKLVLESGSAIKLVFPGARQQSFNLQGHFTKTDSQTWEDVSYTLTGVTQTQTWSVGDASNPNPFTVTGKKLLNSASTYEIIIGDKKPICRILTSEHIDGAAATEYARVDEYEDKFEYLFTTLRSAVAFADSHQKTSSIEMLTDYLISSADSVVVPKDCHITFTTSVTGQNQYPRLLGSTVTEEQQSKRRATISRDVGYTNPLIKMVIENGEEGELKINQLNFDGRNLGGTNEFGVIQTKNCGVDVRNATFENCKAKSGGGISIDFSEDYSGIYEGLVVDSARFIGCESTQGSRVGGGAIWTCAKVLRLSNSSFESCKAYDQGGAVFHRIDATLNGAGKDKAFAYAKDSKSYISNCQFINCESGAAGGFEADSYYIQMTDCIFRNCKAISRNGGGVNIYIYEQKNNAENINITNASTESGTTEAIFEGCVFENCSAKKRGGGLRSLCQITKVMDCTFKNCEAGEEGGAVLLANNNSYLLDVKGCTIDTCKTTGSNKKGGGIYSNAQTLNIGDYEYRDGKQPKDETVGIYTKADDSEDIIKRSTEIKNCASTSDGGGVASDRGPNNDELYTPKDTDHNNPYVNKTSITNATISGNKNSSASKSGGGIYVKAKTVTIIGSTVQNNTATSNGGGICHDVDGGSYRLTIDGSTVKGNTASNQGGGVYTKAQLTLRSDTQIIENKLNSTTKDNAAGVYLPNGRTLTIGDADKASDDYEDSTSVKNNVLTSGASSNQRLWWNTSDPKNQNNENSVSVLCNLSGEIRVINAAKKGTKFGVSTGSFDGFKDSGFKEYDHAFIADDDSLYGVYDRTDEDPSDGRDIIWRGDVICKITDKNGNILYLDAACNEPAIFDRLDYTTDGSKVSAFSYLRQEEPVLYKAKNSLFSFAANDYTCCVKLLVDTVAASDQQSSKSGDLNWTGAYPDRTIILTTAGNTDTDYRYTGKVGTYSVIKGAADRNIINAESNVILRNITLDGGSLKNTRGIYSKPTDSVTVTLEKNAVIRNCTKSNDNGGGVFIENGALVINGGTIYNCSAKNGGGVYHRKGSSVTLQAGTISSCKATEAANGYGGGVCSWSDATSFKMSGGMINNCSANKGGGVYMSRNMYMDMTGGSITSNSATKSGGGISMIDAVSNVQLYFSGQVTVSGNTMNGQPCNVQLDKDSNERIFSYNKAKTKNLGRGSYIGVYVPGDDTGGDTTLFDKHGGEGDPFGTYKESGYDGDSTYLYCFVNDRMGYKGGLQPGGNPNQIYWVKIYSLQIGKQILSDNPDEMLNDLFTFEVTFFTQSGGNKTIINTEFDLLGSDETDKIKSGDTITLGNNQQVMVDNLPEKIGDLDLHYTVVEKKTSNMYVNGVSGKLKYTTTTYNSTGTSSDGGYGVTGIIGNDTGSASSSQFLSIAAFTNQKAICKLTYDGNLLYYENNAKRYIPAVYSELSYAFSRLNETNKDNVLHYKDPWTGQWTDYDAKDSCNIEMLIPEYTMAKNRYVEMNSGKTAVLTTADYNATDGYPYSGQQGTTAAVLSGGSFDKNRSMIKVSGTLTLTDITLDGNNKSSTGYGGIINLAKTTKANLIIEDGTVIKGANNGQHGGAIYVNDTTTLTMNGGSIQNNITTGNMNGGGVYVKNTGTFIINGGSIVDNQCGGKGAGIYLEQGGKLKIKGSPNFGGAGIEDGNFAHSLSGAQNGGEAYGQARQDIYIDGYSDGDAGSLIIAGNITSGDGSIWVWAPTTSIHYRTLEQFAKLDDSLFKTVNGETVLDTSKLGEEQLESAMKAFRNAQIDSVTGADTLGMYLYGIQLTSDTTGKNVYWYGIEGSKPVILRKINAAYESLPGAKFVIYANKEGTKIASDKAGNQLGSADHPLESKADGVFFAGELNYGTYYVKEIEAPDGYSAPSDGYYFIVTVNSNGIGYEYQDPNNPEAMLITREVEATTPA